MVGAFLVFTVELFPPFSPQGTIWFNFMAHFIPHYFIPHYFIWVMSFVLDNPNDRNSNIFIDCYFRSYFFFDGCLRLVSFLYLYFFRMNIFSLNSCTRAQYSILSLPLILILCFRLFELSVFIPFFVLLFSCFLSFSWKCRFFLVWGKYLNCFSLRRKKRERKESFVKVKTTYVSLLFLSSRHHHALFTLIIEFFLDENSHGSVSDWSDFVPNSSRYQMELHPTAFVNIPFLSKKPSSTYHK